MSIAPATGRSARGALLAVLVAATCAVTVSPAVTAPAAAGVVCDLFPDDPALDCTPPDTVIREGSSPSDPTRVGAAGFEFTTAAPEKGATFECSLAGPSQAHDWSDCTTPPPSGATTSEGSKVYSGLAVGRYTFSVRATDARVVVSGGNVDETPATYSWSVLAPDPDDPGADPDDPRTRVTSGAKRWHLYPFIGLTYAADEPTLGFRCTLNGGERSCGSKEGKDGNGRGQANIFGMGPRDHRFTVAAVDEAGNVDRTPAEERWTVPYDSAVQGRYAGGWDKRSGRGYFQDTYSVTTNRGATFQQGHRGFRSAVLVTTRCPRCGTVSVSLGSTVLRTIDLQSATRRQMQVVRLGSWPERRSGTIKVEVTSSGKDVVVDGLGFSRRP